MRGEGLRLEVGMLIRTNYSRETMRILSIDRDCTCPNYLLSLEYKPAPPRRRHLNIVCTKPDGTGRFYLDGWDEQTLLSINKTYCGFKTEIDFDKIEIVESDRPVQSSLF